MSRQTDILFLFASLLIGPPTQSASAQNGGEADSQATVVILGVDHLQNGARAIVYLRPRSTPKAVIAVPKSSVSDEDLAQAFRVVASMHKRSEQLAQKHGAGAIFRADVTGEPDPRKLGDNEHKAYHHYISEFEKAPEMDVVGVGRGRAVTVQMPNWP